MNPSEPEKGAVGTFLRKRSKAAMPPLIYTAELTLDPADQQPFLEWYAFRHAPDLYPIGFQACTCYRAEVGDMTFLDIYEIPGIEIFDGRAYAAMAERDPYAAEILARRSDKAHTVYEQRPLSGEGATLDADWVSVLRFDAEIASEELFSMLADPAAELRSAGALHVRMGERTHDHPVYTTLRPHFLVMSEWSGRPKDEELLFERIPRYLGAAISRVAPFLGRRVYPWPDAGNEEPARR